MKTKINFILLLSLGLMAACGGSGEQQTSESGEEPITAVVGQSGVKDDVSNPNIVQVASGSKDHTTLVAAVQAASLVDALSNTGPFTVFAPTNDAFGKLPAGTVEGLLKPEKKNDLSNILEYHTYVGVLSNTILMDGMEFEMVNGKKIKITRQGDKILVNDKAEVIGSISTSNGMIHVLNEVLLPPQ